MNKLFGALKSKYPGCEVVDVAFAVNPHPWYRYDIKKIDGQLAVAVENAVEVSPEELAQAM